jgi:hypothetical protein
MSDLADEPERARQAEQPRVQVHVDLNAISHDLRAIKVEIARRPARGEALRLALGCLAAVLIVLLLTR